ncbi:hypothetical protein BDR07DRAFT_1488623 [Suillus spraguei]|nr:hypothetical protein BDR07DRAFT_1488623 [Suillus spraguei]
MAISNGVLARQQRDGGAAVPPRPLKRTYALYMESDEESDGDEPPQSIEDVLASVHSRYPALRFPEYIGKMKYHGIFYLPTAAHFDIVFYEKSVGEKQGQRKKKAQVQFGDKDKENIPPSFD